MLVLASDYDGTLTLKGTVSTEDKEAIDKWRKAGNLFGIISGRSYSDIRNEMQHHDFCCDFLICNNGSLIFEGESAEPVYQINADGNVLQSIVPFIIEVGGWRASITQVHERKQVIFNSEQEHDPRENWIKTDDLKHITYFNQLDTRLDDEDQAKEITEQVNHQYGKYVTACQNGVNIDIVPVGVDKAVGLLRYISLKNIPKEHTLVIGDNYNDLSMIMEFDGFAVTSGRPEVIAMAKKVYHSIAGLIWENMSQS